MIQSEYSVVMYSRQQKTNYKATPGVRDVPQWQHAYEIISMLALL